MVSAWSRCKLALSKPVSELFRGRAFTVQPRKSYANLCPPGRRKVSSAASRLGVVLACLWWRLTLGLHILLNCLPAVEGAGGYLHVFWVYGLDPCVLGCYPLWIAVSQGMKSLCFSRILFKERALIVAPSSHDGSAYELDYSVPVKARTNTKYMLCGTNQCNKCDVTACEGHQLEHYPELDRDKDKEDLKPCPIGFATLRYEKYPQIWPFADVYLRICRRLYN